MRCVEHNDKADALWILGRIAMCGVYNCFGFPALRITNRVNTIKIILWKSNES